MTTEMLQVSPHHSLATSDSLTTADSIAASDSLATVAGSLASVADSLAGVAKSLAGVIASPATATFPKNVWLALQLYFQKITSLTPQQLLPVLYVLSAILLLWAVMSIYSIHRWRKWKDRIKLGRFTSSGDMDQVEGEELKLMLRAQLEKITSTYTKKRSGVASLYTATAAGEGFRGLYTALTCAWPKITPPEIADLDELKIKLWNVEIPIARFVRLIVVLLRVGLPVPKRDRYLNSVIHGSITVVNKKAVLVIYKGAPPAGIVRAAKVTTDSGEYAGAGFSLTRAGKAAKEAWSRVSEARVRDRLPATALSACAVVETAAELENLMRRGAFMVLELSEATEPVGNAESVRHLADGLNILDRHAETGDDALLLGAEKHFKEAAHADSSNHLASYFYATLLLNQRSRQSIMLARQFFTRAEAHTQDMLKALVQTGLANCHMQCCHRLAARPEDELSKAEDYLEKAKTTWTQSPALSAEDAGDVPYLKEPKEHLHPWIVATEILKKHIKVEFEDSDTIEKNRPMYEGAVRDYLKAMENEFENAGLPNNLGWLLLKLSEGGLKGIGGVGFPEVIREKKLERLEELSEHYFLQALELKPENKLTHANLSLLYATEFFREQGGTKYLEQSKFHGKKAIQIDSSYVNGHRDLAVSLIRYGEFEEAYFYYLKALWLAEVITKDHQIMKNARNALDKRKEDKEDVTDEIRRVFEYPPAEFLDPPKIMKTKRRAEREGVKKDVDDQEKESDQKEPEGEYDEAAEVDAELWKIVKEKWESIRAPAAD